MEVEQRCLLNSISDTDTYKVQCCNNSPLHGNHTAGHSGIHFLDILLSLIYSFDEEGECPWKFI